MQAIEHCICKLVSSLPQQPSSSDVQDGQKHQTSFRQAEHSRWGTPQQSKAATKAYFAARTEGCQGKPWMLAQLGKTQLSNEQSELQRKGCAKTRWRLDLEKEVLEKSQAGTEFVKVLQENLETFPDEPWNSVKQRTKENPKACFVGIAERQQRAVHGSEQSCRVPVVPGVPDGPVAAEFVTLQLVKSVLPVGVFSGLQHLGGQVSLLVKSPPAALLSRGSPRHLEQRQAAEHQGEQLAHA